jgi:hypothetical protein
MENKMVENTKGEGSFIKISKKKSCAKEIFESINGCKHPLIASGATPIRIAGRAPEKSKQEQRSWKDEKTIYLSLYSKKLSTIASGSTPIESTSRAPDDDKYWVLSEESSTY